MPDQRDDVLNFIKYNGPVLPVQIAKHINTNILFSSAILSELVARKILRITHASIGGSPLYYLPGQEELMDSRLSTALNGREKEAYQLLKEKKVLWEKEMEPWQRVAVKDLKDFSVQIAVNNEGNSEVFWKHSLVSDEEAKLIISEIISDAYGPEIQEQENLANESIAKIDLQPKVEDLQELEDEKIEVVNSLVNEIKNKETIQETLNEQKPIKCKETKKKTKEESDFYSKVIEFIKDNGVDILKEELIKKDKEFDFLVNIPSSFGNLMYLIKAKNKPSINEADISMAFSEGQLRKMPVVLLTNGKPNKKASILIEQKMQGQLILKEI
ncbi:hypothetical protein J4230_05810 [Candidatus Woesearchaeota archaeon]|nr:hypothetical protein [Candidatus Woesearchaeota archaeon]